MSDIPSGAPSFTKEPDTHIAFDNNSDGTGNTASIKKQILKFLNKKDNYAEKPADGGLTAWLQVVGCFFIFMNNFGLASAFGVFQAYYQEFLLRDYSPSQISWIGTLQMALMLIVGVASGLLSGICTGMLYIPSIAQIPQYFDKHLGLALGLVLSGASVGGIVYPLMFRKLLLTIGFGGATRAIGFLAMGLLAISIVLVKPLTLPNRPKKVFDPKMFKNVYFVTYVFAAWFVFAGLLIPYFDCATYWWTNFGHNIDDSFYTLLIINAGNGVGRVLITASTDYKLTHAVGPEGLTLICFIAMIVLGFGWIAVTTKASYYAFLVLWGFFSAAGATLPPLTLKILVPRLEVFATSMGVVYASAGLGSLVGVPIANAAGKSGWLGTQLFTGIMGTVATVFTFISATEVRRRRLNPELRK